MKKNLIIVQCFLVSCGSNSLSAIDSLNEIKMIKYDVDISSNIVSWNFNELVNGSYNHQPFDDYNDLEKNAKNIVLHNSYFLSIYPKDLEDNFLAPEPIFNLCFYKTEKEGQDDCRLIEEFLVYNEFLGVNHPGFDGYDYSISFFCVFYCTNEKSDNLKLVFEKVDDTYSDKITIFNKQTVLGYIFADHPNLDIFSFLLEYLKENLLFI